MSLTFVPLVIVYATAMQNPRANNQKSENFLKVEQGNFMENSGIFKREKRKFVKNETVPFNHVKVQSHLNACPISTMSFERTFATTSYHSDGNSRFHLTIPL